MFVGMVAFKKDFNDFTKRMVREGNKAIREEAKEWFAELVYLTPKDTGFAAYNWKVSVDVKPSTELVRNPRNKGPYPSSIPEGIEGATIRSKIYMYNNVAYIKKLEDGWSKQAPKNFVKNSARRANNRLQKRFDGIK